MHQAFTTKTAQKIAMYGPIIEGQRAGRRYTYIPLVFSAFGAASDQTLTHLDKMFSQHSWMKAIVIKKITMTIIVHAGRAIRKYWGDRYEAADRDMDGG